MWHLILCNRPTFLPQLLYPSFLPANSSPKISHILFIHVRVLWPTGGSSVLENCRWVSKLQCMSTLLTLKKGHNTLQSQEVMPQILAGVGLLHRGKACHLLWWNTLIFFKEACQWRLNPTNGLSLLVYIRFWFCGSKNTLFSAVYMVNKVLLWQVTAQNFSTKYCVANRWIYLSFAKTWVFIDRFHSSA